MEQMEPNANNSQKKDVASNEEDMFAIPSRGQTTPNPFITPRHTSMELDDYFVSY